MLTKTTISAVRTLIYLGRQASAAPAPPRVIAEQLGESPTYLAKVTQMLARAGILRTQRGVAGGVILNRRPDEITLLAIVEACQGAILGGFCDASDPADLPHACAFHQAGLELHGAIVGVLSRWTLARLLEKPYPTAKHLHERCLVRAGLFSVARNTIKDDVG